MALPSLPPFLGVPDSLPTAHHFIYLPPLPISLKSEQAEITAFLSPHPDPGLPPVSWDTWVILPHVDYSLTTYPSELLCQSSNQNFSNCFDCFKA